MPMKKDTKKFLEGITTDNLVALYTIKRTKKGIKAGFAYRFKTDKERERTANFLIEQAIEVLGEEYVIRLFAEEMAQRNRTMYG